jgi:lipase maturation factor 1
VRLPRALLQGIYPGASGPAVAVAFHRLFAVIVIIAWASLGAQITVLVGERGLLPLRPFLQAVRAQGDLPLFGYPSLLRWPALATDGLLQLGTSMGIVLGLLALAGVRPRLCFGLSTALYLSYATACRGFLAFQWDNLLLECGLLAALLPADRRAPMVHLLLRVVLFKVYFESGLAKWQSYLRDWHDGSAMTYYFETAPLPTWLAWHAHNLPAWWHHFESRATLILELIVPLGIFGPRPARLAAAGAFTGFQILNLSTGNYGFFCYLSLALHLFLLDDQDVERLLVRVRPRLPARWRQRLVGLPSAPPAPVAAPCRWWRRSLRIVGGAGAALFLGISLLEALERFGPRGRWQESAAPFQRLYAPLRLVNTYHLFASITRERIEVEFQTLTDDLWRPYHLRHKPGDPGRAPNFVAPHQPRVDFQLWFYGLAWQRQEPPYVAALVHRLCESPALVQSLFRDRLPAGPDAVRIAYHRYQFTTPPERRATGQFWRRTLVATSPAVSCHR